MYTTSHTPYGLLAGSRSLTPTAVILAAFDVAPATGGLLLAWETAQETTTVGFNLYRSEADRDSDTGGLPQGLNEQLIPAKLPGSPRGASYAHLDSSAEANIAYLYWLETIDVHGEARRHGPSSGLMQPYESVYLPLVFK